MSDAIQDDYELSTWGFGRKVLSQVLPVEPLENLRITGSGVNLGKR